MSESVEQPEDTPTYTESGTQTWSIHPSIDPIKARDKAHKPKSDDIGWKYAWCPTPTEKNIVQCLLCAKIYRGGIKRQKEHLIGGFPDVVKCPKTTAAIRDEMLLWKNREQKRKLPVMSVQCAGLYRRVGWVFRKPVEEVYRKPSTVSLGVGKKVGPLDVIYREDLFRFVSNRHSEKKQTVIENHFKKEEKEIVDMIFAGAIYSNGLSFNLCRQLDIEVLCEAIGRYGHGYVPPSYHALRKTLLEKTYESVADLKFTYDSHWQKYGVTLMTDCWTDRRGRSLLNFLVNCPEGTFFLNSVQASSEEKTADFLVGLIEEHMEMVGVQNVVQVCTDNASNYVLAGKKLMAKYPKLFWTPCVAHCHDLCEKLYQCIYEANTSCSIPSVRKKNVDDVSDFFGQNVKCLVGNGQTASFWKDRWIAEKPLKVMFLNIFRLSTS